MILMIQSWLFYFWHTGYLGKQPSIAVGTGAISKLDKHKSTASFTSLFFSIRLACLVAKTHKLFWGANSWEELRYESWLDKMYFQHLVTLRMPDASGSEMSTSMNSDASYDIDIVRHHDGGWFVMVLHALKMFYFQLPPPLPTSWTQVTRIQSLRVKRRSADMENRKMWADFFLQNLTQGTKISIFVHLIMTHDACWLEVQSMPALRTTIPQKYLL